MKVAATQEVEQLRFSCWLLIYLGLAGLPIEATAGSPSIAIWRTDLGSMRLVILDELVDGTISTAGTRFYGETRSDQVVIGRWFQDSSSIRCATDIAGNFYWGVFTLKPKGEDHFLGSLTYCDAPIETAEWFEGVLVVGDPWYENERNGTKAVRRPALDMRKGVAESLMYRLFDETIDPENSVKSRFDMTCDGGLDLVYVWQHRPGSDILVSVFHNQLQIYDGEDTASVETISLGGNASEIPAKCRVGSINDLSVIEIDPEIRMSISATHLMPSCTKLLAISDNKCLIYWSLEASKIQAE